MKKISIQFSLLVISFFALWFALSNINYVDLFKIEEFSKENEKKLAKIILDVIKNKESESDSDSLKSIVRTIAKRICDSNNVNIDNITIHVIESDDINAFALPDRNMLVYTGLIKYCNSAEELAGVIAHEIGHMEKNHVNKKLVKEIGVAMLTVIVGGDSNRETLAELAKVLSSTAFDREQESDADIFAVEALTKSNIDPEHLSNFLFRLAREKDDLPKSLEWISTHPNSKDRAAEILKLRKKHSFDIVPLFEGSWENIAKNI